MSELIAIRKIDFKSSDIQFFGEKYIFEDYADNYCIIKKIETHPNVTTITLVKYMPDDTPIRSYADHILARIEGISILNIPSKYFCQIELLCSDKKLIRFFDLTETEINIIYPDGSSRTIETGTYCYCNDRLNPRYNNKVYTFKNGKYTVKKTKNGDVANITEYHIVGYNGVLQYPPTISKINGMPAKLASHCKITFQTVGITCIRMQVIPDMFRDKMSQFTDLKKIVLNDTDYRSIICDIYRSCELVDGDETEEEMKKEISTQYIWYHLIKRGIVIEFVNDNGDIVKSIDFTADSFNIDWIVKNSPIKIEKISDLIFKANINGRYQFLSIQDILNIGRYMTFKNEREIDSEYIETEEDLGWGDSREETYYKIPGHPGLFKYVVSETEEIRTYSYSSIMALTEEELKNMTE